MPAELSVIGRDAGDGAQALSAIEAPGRAFERVDGLIDSQFKPLDQFHRIGALGKQRKAVLHEEIGEHGGGCRSVARDFIGLLGDFANDLSAHILERAFELDLARDADAVARHDRRADRAVHHRVHASGAKRAADGLGQFGDAATQGLSGLSVVQHDLGHRRVLVKLHVLR